MSAFNSTRCFVMACTLAAFFLLTASFVSAADPGKNGRIAFVAFYSGGPQIYTSNPDGTDVFQVTNLPPATDGLAYFPDFSPDGKSIAFSHDMSGALELYTINLDGTGPTQITHDGLVHVVPRCSPDGSHIVFALRDTYELLVIATIRGSASRSSGTIRAQWRFSDEIHRIPRGELAPASA